MALLSSPHPSAESADGHGWPTSRLVLVGYPQSSPDCDLQSLESEHHPEPCAAVLSSRVRKRSTKCYSSPQCSCASKVCAFRGTFLLHFGAFETFEYLATLRILLNFSDTLDSKVLKFRTFRILSRRLLEHFGILLGSFRNRELFRIQPLAKSESFCFYYTKSSGQLVAFKSQRFGAQPRPVP